MKYYTALRHSVVHCIQLHDIALYSILLYDTVQCRTCWLAAPWFRAGAARRRGGRGTPSYTRHSLQLLRDSRPRERGSSASFRRGLLGAHPACRPGFHCYSYSNLSAGNDRGLLGAVTQHHKQQQEGVWVCGYHLRRADVRKKQHLASCPEMRVQEVDNTDRGGLRFMREMFSLVFTGPVVSKIIGVPSWSGCCTLYAPGYYPVIRFFILP